MSDYLKVVYDEKTHPYNEYPEKLYTKLCNKGIHCNSEPLIAPDGKAKVLYCHDPDGIILELVEEL